MTCEIQAICAGLPKPFNGAELSAIVKAPVAGRVKIRTFGIEGDMVADTKHHGGADMAVHHYPGDHYADWNDWLGGHDVCAEDVIGRAADRVKSFQELPKRPGFWRDFVPPETLAAND